MKRSDFIKQGGILLTGSVLSGSPLASLAKDSPIRLTVLHTNDWHSRIEPFGSDGGVYKGMGGASVRAALIKKIRATEEHVLLLDAGDIFQGTPYFNLYQGEPEFKLMSAMGYDAVTLGNHDFDAGIDGLVKQIPLATFSFLNANYDVRDTALEGKLLPYKLFKKGPLTIGVFGVGINPDGLIPTHLCKGVRYNNPIPIADAIAKQLKTTHGCQVVICLSHLGYRYENNLVSDIHLAENTSHIDFIMGGHTHTFLSAPDIRKNASGKPVSIHQVGWAGLQLGRIDLLFSTRNLNLENARVSSIPVFGQKS